MKTFSALLLGTGLLLAGSVQMQAITGSPLVEEPGAGISEQWTRSSMSFFSLGGMFEDNSPAYGGAVVMVMAEDGAVWIDHVISGFDCQGWTVGKIEGDRLTVELPQEVYREDGKPYYLALVDNDGNNQFTYSATQTLVFSKVGNGWKSDIDSLSRIVALVSQDGGFVGAGDYDIDFTPFEAPEVPSDEGVAYKSYSFYNGGYGHYIEVGFKEDEVFFKGLLAEAPEEYIVGTLENSEISLLSGGYLGISYPDSSSPLYNYFVAASEDRFGEFTGENELVFTYNSATGVIESKGSFVYNQTPDIETLAYSKYCDAPRMVPGSGSTFMVPANPTSVRYASGNESVVAIIPQLSTQGGLLDADELYYQMYVDGELFTFFQDEYRYLDMEEMTEIPYAYSERFDFWVNGTYHEIYLYTVGSEVVGIQSVYYNRNGERAVSDIVNTDGTIIEAATENGIAGVSAGIAGEECYDLLGRRVAADAKGLLIKRTVGADGRTVTRKVRVR